MAQSGCGGYKEDGFLAFTPLATAPQSKRKTYNPEENDKMKKITKVKLKKWGACKDGYKYFCKMFPDGEYLQTVSEVLIDEGHLSWDDWLWSKCKQDSNYIDQTVVIAGYGGTASAGYGGTASAGNWGTASAGNWGTASAGNWGTASAGYGGMASAGDLGTASAGDRGTASAGDGGTASAGDLGTASAGYGGTASAGDGGTASSGDRGTASAGYGGAIIIMFYDGCNYIKKCDEVGIGGLKPNVKYRLDENGNFIEA